MRPRYETLRAQVDGDDLDLEALVRSRAEVLASGTPSDRIYLATQKRSRDLAVALLVDTSLSTESWVANQRVIDIARETALLFCHALDAGADPHAVYSFTSRGRHDVRVNAIKEFAEHLSPTVIQRIAALKPGQYTRIGAAVRHTVAQLANSAARHRLLLTDGNPNDIDHYEGRFGVENTRPAIQEARRTEVKDCKRPSPILKRRLSLMNLFKSADRRNNRRRPFSIQFSQSVQLSLNTRRQFG